MLTACSKSKIEESPTPVPERQRAGWELVWQDEFDGKTINTENWVFDTGSPA